MTTSWACLSPTYPTMPHMGRSLSARSGRPGPRSARHAYWNNARHAQRCAGKRAVPVRRARPGRLGRAGRRTSTSRCRAEEITRLRGLGDQLDLDEVQQVYLPLSRLLSLYVEAARRAAPQAGGVPAPAAAAAHAVRDRARRLGRGRQVDDRARAAADARATGPSTPTSRWSPPTASSTPTPSSSAAGSCSARASPSPTTAGRCCASSSTSSPARTRSRRRRTPTSCTTWCPTTRSWCGTPTS